MIIQTNRLILRRTEASDWKAVQAIWEDQIKSEYAKYDRPNDTSDSAAQKRIAKWAAFADGTEHIFFSVILQNTMIGYISLNQRSSGYEIGYCFHSRFHGNGYARESLAAAIEYLKKHGCKTVIAGTALQNTPSVRLLLSLGFSLSETETVSFYKDRNGNDICFEGGIFNLNL